MIVTTYKNNEVLVSRIEPDNYILQENETDKLCTQSFVKPMFDGQNYYEGGTIEIEVPQTIQRMNLKIELLKLGISIESILQVINGIPSEYMSDLDKQIAIIKFQEANFFERENTDLILVASFLEVDLDQLFINGNQY